MGRTTRHFNNALWEKGDAPKKLREKIGPDVAISWTLYDALTGKPYVKMVNRKTYTNWMKRLKPNSQDLTTLKHWPIDDAEWLFSKEILESSLYQNIRDLVERELPLFSWYSKEIEMNDNPVNIWKVNWVFGGIYLNYTTKEGKKVIINVDVDKEKESFILAYKNWNKIEVNEKILDSIKKDLWFDKY